MASAPSRASTGAVFAAPNGRRIVSCLAIESAAHCEKKKCRRKTVARTWTTIEPDQFSACSPSQGRPLAPTALSGARLAAQGLAIAMSTHRPDHALVYASRVALMRDGHFLAIGPPSEVMSEASLRELYGIEVRILSSVDPRTGAAIRACVAPPQMD